MIECFFFLLSVSCAQVLQHGRCVDVSVAALMNSLFPSQDFYTDNPKTCPDFGRIINQRHFKRIMAMTEDSTIAVGGDNDESDCYIGRPTAFVSHKAS